MSFQSYLNNIQTKTGKSPEDFQKMADKKGYLNPLAKATVITDWLKKDFGLGHGHAVAIFAYLKGKRE